MAVENPRFLNVFFFLITWISMVHFPARHVWNLVGYLYHQMQERPGECQWLWSDGREHPTHPKLRGTGASVWPAGRGPWVNDSHNTGGTWRNDLNVTWLLLYVSIYILSMIMNCHYHYYSHVLIYLNLGMWLHQRLWTRLLCARSSRSSTSASMSPGRTHRWWKRKFRRGNGNSDVNGWWTASIQLVHAWL